MNIYREKYRNLPVRNNCKHLHLFNKMVQVLFLIILFLLQSRLSAQVISDSKILFLHLKMKNDKVELIDYTIKPGIIKQKRTPDDEKEFYYEAKSKTNTLLYKESMDNPLVRILEYEDEKVPGKINKKIIKTDTADFTLRIPYKETLSEVAFFSKEETLTTKGEKKILNKSINKIIIDFKKESGGK
jgi:hypothetical protein